MTVAKRHSLLARTFLCMMVLAACAPATGAPPGPASAAAPAAGATAATRVEPTQPAALTKIVLVSDQQSTGDLPSWIDQEAGIFAKNGLEVDRQLVGNAPTAIAALISNEAQFTQAAASNALLPNASGADLVILSIVVPTFNYILMSSPDIKTPEDLRGKIVGVGNPGDMGDMGVRAALKRIGLDPDKDVTMRSGLPSASVRSTALRSGAINAAVVSPPENLYLSRDGFTSLLDVAALKVPTAGQATIAARAYVTAHPDVVQKYIDSLIEGVVRLKADKPLSIDIMRRNLKLEDEEALSFTYDFYAQQIFASVPDPDPALFAETMVELAKVNEAVKNLDLSRIIDRSFVKNAVDRGLAGPR